MSVRVYCSLYKHLLKGVKGLWILLDGAIYPPKENKRKQKKKPFAPWVNSENTTVIDREMITKTSKDS